MPIHIVNDWSVAKQDGDDATYTFLFWLDKKFPGLVTGKSATTAIGASYFGKASKTKTTYEHRLTAIKVTKSTQFKGWTVQSGLDTFCFTLTRKSTIVEENAESKKRVRRELQTNEDLEALLGTAS
jgi:hypothetical protein